MKLKEIIFEKENIQIEKGYGGGLTDLHGFIGKTGSVRERVVHEAC